MARVELKHSDMRFRDGYRATAAINDTPVAGDTTLLIDTLVVTSDGGGPVPVSSLFTFGADPFGADNPNRYKVTAKNDNEVQTVTVAGASSGNFTLGFTGTVANPIAEQTTANILYNATGAQVQSALEALAAIAVGDVTVTGDGPYVIEFKGAYLGKDMVLLNAVDVDLDAGTVTAVQTYQGGVTHEITFTPALSTALGVPANDDPISFTGRTLEFKVGDGDLNYEQTKEYNYDLDRDVLDTVREGAQQPLSVSLDFVWETMAAIVGSATPTVAEVLDKIGEAADWVNADPDPCTPYSVDLEVEITKPCGGEHEVYTFPTYRYESFNPTLADAQISSSGRCNVLRPTIIRLS